MSTTGMLTGNALTVKKWEMETWLENFQRSVLGHLINRGSIYYTDRFLGNDARGDELTFAYAGRLTSIPQGEGGTLINNLEALNLTSYKMAINVCRFGVQNPNTDTIEQQRTYVNFENVSRKQLSKRAKVFIENSIFQQAAGTSPTSITVDGTTFTSSASTTTFVQGLNSIIAPTSERIIWAGGVSADESLTSTNTFTLDLIDAAIELAETSSQPIERLDGDEFDLFLHPTQVTDLKRDTSGKIQWYNMQLSYLTGGAKEGSAGNYLSNGMADGISCLGRYNNVNIYSAYRVAAGVNSSTSAPITTVRRAILFGRDALSFASPFGGRLKDKDVPTKFFFEYQDFDYYKAMEARLIYGLKKMSWTNFQDNGSMVISTYAASHTS
jgi:hypothetical protein